MKADKILSSLCYFSVFFAPFLFPIIIFIIASGNVRYHAGKALWTHLVPYLSFFIGVGALVLNAGNQTTTLIIICMFTLIGIYYIILNIVRGIKVLLES
ncbi:DUF4870 domain-containing protein [Virgibacillus sp. NKC19-3]|uniref:DUF4870 domain-containing protein n=1 Tax=Virgibacillus saliphilus TaxID=2831674 RepID=UPI001C9B1121|nr:DUF4870 domain-containing protein [Virgibacillus sp. NKC19-3]MBY7142695.1 DUF4870 domain-containing protein [Virgibacillus sp. NKC19-3]